MAHKLLQEHFQEHFQDPESTTTGCEIDGVFYEYSKEMRQYIQETLDVIKNIQDSYFKNKFNAEISVYSEKTLDISFITGEAGATGTADVVIVMPDELVILDLKYGMTLIEAEENEQLLIYGAAAVKHFAPLGQEVKWVRMVISQPRLDSVSEWRLAIADVNARVAQVRDTAYRVLAGKDKLPPANPGKKQCQFCRAKLNCAEYIGFTELTVDKTLPMFSITDTQLADAMEKIDFIKDWCKAIKAETLRRLERGTFSDSRFKLVKGRGGNAKWVDEALVKGLALSHEIPLDAIVTSAMKSPTALIKEFKGSEFAHAVKQAIIRTDGALTIALHSDKRPAVSALLFDNLEEIDRQNNLTALSEA